MELILWWKTGDSPCYGCHTVPQLKAWRAHGFQPFKQSPEGNNVVKLLHTNPVHHACLYTRYLWWMKLCVGSFESICLLQSFCTEMQRQDSYHSTFPVCERLASISWHYLSIAAEKREILNTIHLGQWINFFHTKRVFLALTASFPARTTSISLILWITYLFLQIKATKTLVESGHWFLFPQPILWIMIFKISK